VYAATFVQNRFFCLPTYIRRPRQGGLPTYIRRPRQGGSHRNIAIPFGMEKLEWLGYPMVKKFRRYLYSF